MPAVTLLIAVELRALVGAPEEELAALGARVCRPLLAFLLDNPIIQLSLRLSGAALEWLEACDLDSLGRLQELVGREQVEVLGGPHHDVPLHALPSRDAQAQVLRHQQHLERLLRVSPRGLWLPESAWDANIPRILARSEPGYAFLDGRLLQAAGARRLGGWYAAEREGVSLGVFPTDAALAPLFPWGTPRAIALALRERLQAGQEVVALALPGAHLGLLPRTDVWCWHEKGWFQAFSRLLRAQPWIRCGLPGAWFARNRPLGTLPPVAGTPPEHGLALLPLEAGQTLSKLLRGLEKGNDPVLAEASPWLIGPPWEAALARHEAAARLHHYMLHVSAQCARLQKRAERGLVARDVLERAFALLHRGQCGGALSLAEGGGLARGEIRHAAWAALGEADALSRRELGQNEGVSYKISEGVGGMGPEVAVHTPWHRFLIRPAAGGALAELQLWGAGNLLNTFTRGRELWHADLTASSWLPVLVGAPADPPREGEGGGLAPPALPALDEGLAELSEDDRHPRLMFLEHFLGPETTLDNLRRGQHPQAGDFLAAPYELVRAEREESGEVFIVLARDGQVKVGDAPRMARIDKRYWFRPGDPAVGLIYDISNRYAEPIQTRFAVEMNLNLDSRTEGAFLSCGDNRRYSLHRSGQRRGVAEIELGWGDVRWTLSCSQPGQLSFYPIYTPIRTPQGYRRGFQGISLVLDWDLELWGMERHRIDLSFSALLSSGGGSRAAGL